MAGSEGAPSVNRGEIVAGLERILALLEGPLSAVERAEARSAVERLRAAIECGDLFDPGGCPFEPGTVRLTGLQSRPAKPVRLSKKPASKPPRPAAAKAPKKPAPRSSSSDGVPLTGRIASMVRAGVPTEEIVRMYRIKPEHVEAFIASFVTAVSSPVPES